MSRPLNKKQLLKIVLLILLVLTGIILHQLGWLDWRRLIDEGERFAHTWWFAPAIIAIKIVLYTMALPGSLLIWVAGLFYGPVTATVITVIGGVGGAIAAYCFARSMTGRDIGSVERSRLFGFLQKHSDFATLCAIRSFPSFPHTVINFGAGILKVPLPRFIGSSAVGFAIKGYLYTSLIRQAATAEDISDVFDGGTIGILMVVAALFIAGKAIGHYTGSDEQP